MARWRLATCGVVLLALLGLPMAAVVCDLACPEAATAVAVATPSPERVAPVHGAPCHESAAAQRSSGAPVVIEPGAVVHGCDHPAVVSTHRPFDGLRLHAPAASSAGVARHLAAGLAPHAVMAALAPARPPTPPPLGGFSPVLRI